MSDNFPPELAQFIKQHIKSLTGLETLLLVRQDVERAWTPAEVATALYTSEATCTLQLADFARHGFLEHAGGDCYRYKPVDEHLDRLLGKLADVYQERRVSVISRIYSL